VTAWPRGRRRTALRAFSQLRVRVLAGVLLVIILALAAFDVAVITGLRGYLVSQADERLQSVVALYRPFEVASITVVPPAAARPAQFAARGSVNFKRAGGGKPVERVTQIAGPRVFLGPVLDEYWAECVACQGRKVLVGGDPALRPLLPSDLHAIAAAHLAQTVHGRNGSALLRLRAAREGKAGILVVSTSLSGVSKTVDKLELFLGIGSAVAALLAGLGVAGIARRGLRPIETMAAQADGITAGDLTSRVLMGDPRTEVGRLGTALNGMLARIEAAVREQEASQELMRQFFADASHELRNPLASLRANAELYQQGALPARPQVDEAMRRIGLEARRMSALVDSMLRLARLDQGPGQPPETEAGAVRELVDLSALAAECAERARIADPGRPWTARIEDGLLVSGDEELLRQAIDNLLANVRVHTPAGAPARITAAAGGGQVTVRVSDSGPGVDPAELPRIFDRFYRAGTPSRSRRGAAGPGGSGLGLAIVSAIAAAHDGAAAAASGSPRGLRVTITLPAAMPGTVPAADDEPLALAGAHTVLT
jgi:two-component system OmpR family sensor kinase